MEGVISPEDISELNAGLDLLYAIQCEEAGGEENLAKINDLDIVRCPLAYNPLFLTLAINHTITRIAKAVLGEQVVLLMQNGVINRPDRVQCQTKWHRDLNYQHWVSSRPLALSAFVALEDFSTVTGGTVFLPSSHRSEEFPSEQLISRMEVQPEVPAGSVLFFDAMTFHRAGVNRSGRIRRGINHVIGLPILAQQFDIPALLGREEPEDQWVADYLGYRWRPCPSIAGWRFKKLAQSRS
jgi:ectoine hydroxylase-related dioxygenase (phytanoyl-CoA dioxygenase family)